MELAKHLQNLGTETAFAVSGAAAAWAAQGHKVYPFHLGDLNIATPPNIVEAMNKAIADGYTGYCPGAGIPELREVLADDVGRKRQVVYNADQVSIQPGGKPIIAKFLYAVMDAGDEVLYPNPGFPIYESQIEFQGGVAVPYGYVETETGFDMDLDAIRAAITPRTKALIYNNYQNPIGAESSREEMEALAELIIEHDLWLLSDDAYYEVQYKGDGISIVNIPGMQERTVILYTCSKRFAMTGWRLGAGIGPQPIIDMINRMNTNIESCTAHFIQRAMVDNLADETGPNAILEELKARRDAAAAGLNAIDGIHIVAPESTFYLFPNVSAVMERKGMTDVNDLMTGALEQTNVSFCTRKHFGRPIPGQENNYIRLAYSGIDVPMIEEGLGNLKAYFEA